MLAAPLFVRDLSVNDVIAVELAEDVVHSWSHLHRSGHTTIWVLRVGAAKQVDEVLSRLRELGCRTVQSEALGCSSVDVPGDVEMGVVDAQLGALDPDELAVAYPSFRHKE